MAELETNRAIEQKDNWRNLDWMTIILSAVVLVVILATIRFMMNIVLLTFVLTFIFYSLLRVIRKGLDKTPLRRIPDGPILALIYILGLGFISLCATAFTSVLVEQITEIATAFINFDYNAFRESLDPRLGDLIWGLDVSSYLRDAGKAILNWLPSVGKFSFNLVLAIALSFLLLMEKKKLRIFGQVMEKSRIAAIYGYLITFGISFCRTFGKVMKVQVIIAFVNGVLSIVMLAVLHFPNIWGLGVMIFLLGLVPVAGVIISLIPLTIIAFNIGGVTKVIQILVMVAIIHVVEAYVLNPKLMADRTDLPICFVFIILLVAEYYLKFWGLLIGIPLFIFLMTILEVRYEDALHKERKPDGWLKRLRARYQERKKSPPL